LRDLLNSVAVALRPTLEAAIKKKIGALRSDIEE